METAEGDSVLENDARRDPDSASLELADVLEGGSACELKEPIPKSGNSGSAAGPFAALETGVRTYFPRESVQDSRGGERAAAASVFNSDPVWRHGAMTGPETPIFSRSGCGSPVSRNLGRCNPLVFVH